MIKVIHLITTLSRGGAENQLKVLVREQVRMGYKVTVYYLKDNPELKKEFRDLGAYIDESLYGRNFIYQVIVLRFRLRDFAGVVHAHLPRAELLGSLAVRKNKLVVTRHNAEPFHPTSARFISKILSNFVQSRSVFVICISMAVKDFVLQRKEITDDRIIRVVYYGFDNDIPNVGPRTQKIEDKTFVVGTVVRLVPQKDLPTLLRAFTEFNRRHPKSKLRIVGDGELRNHLIEFAKQLRIEDSVIWVGKTQDVVAEYKKMDLFVLPSKYEGFGMVLLEAFQSGLAVVAARVSAIPEVLGAGSDGLFTSGNSDELTSKLLRFYDDKSRFDLAASQKSELMRFRPEVMSESLDKLYRDVISRGH